MIISWVTSLTIRMLPVTAVFPTEEGDQWQGRRKAPVPLSASYTSTLSEEMVVLLRSLHSHQAWNPVINTYVVHNLRLLTDMLNDHPASLVVSGLPTYLTCRWLIELQHERFAGLCHIESIDSVPFFWLDG